MLGHYGRRCYHFLSDEVERKKIACKNLNSIIKKIWKQCGSEEKLLF